MKKRGLSLLLIILTSSLIVSSSYGQGFFFRIYPGYSFGIAKQGSNSLIDASNSSQTVHIEGFSFYTISETSRVALSFGKGIDLGLTGGYNFTENIGASLGIGYKFGGKNTITDKSTNTSGETDITTNTFKSRLLSFVPGIELNANTDILNPYARIGLIIGIPSFTGEHSYEPFGDAKVNGKVKYSGGISWGVQGALGVVYNLSDLAGIFIEANLSSMSYAPKTAIMTEYTVDGANKLDDLKTDEKEVEFVNEYELDSRNTVDHDKPAVELKEYFPFSSFGIAVGFCMRFNK